MFLLHEMRVKVVGFDSIRELNEDDVDFKEAWVACKNPINKVKIISF